MNSLFFLRVLRHARNLIGIWSVLVASVIARAQFDERVERAHHFSEPVYWVGETPPTEAETVALVDALNKPGPNGTEHLEQYLAQNINSPWSPSIEANLAWKYRQQSRYTRALELWEDVWPVVKDETSLGGQRVREFVLGTWPGLLSGLGRKDRLVALGKDNGDRMFSNRAHQIAFNRALETAAIMQHTPAISYRCGPLAMYNVARTMGLVEDERNHPRTKTTLYKNGYPQSISDLRRWGSPTNGFSAEQLVEAADGLGLDWVAAQRPHRGTIASPAVIHWKQDHYAAIVGHTNGYCLVVDPTFGETEHWVSDAVIEEEASGVFLLPLSAVPKDWRSLQKHEVSNIRGQGVSASMADQKDTKKPVCPNCPGMPIWWASEPYLNLWMADQPVGWQTSEGQPMGYVINYKQREARNYPTVNRSVNTDLAPLTWNDNWLSWIEIQDTQTYWPIQYDCNGLNLLVADPLYTSISCDGGGWTTTPTPPNPGGTRLCSSPLYYPGTPVPTNQIISANYLATGGTSFDGTYTLYCWQIRPDSVIYGDPPDLFQNISANVYLPEGGQLIFNSLTTSGGIATSTIDADNHIQLIVTNNGTFPNRITGATVLYADGSQDAYTLVKRVTRQVGDPSYSAKAFRTAHYDPSGRKTTFNYDQANPTSNPLIRMSSVVDSDGRTAAITYHPTISDLITQVTDPYGRTATLAYDSSNRLYSITDAVGMTSTIQYDALGASMLTTPYGITSFDKHEQRTSDPSEIGNVAGSAMVNRAVLANEPGGAKQLYIYESSFLANSVNYDMYPLPSTTGFDTSLRPVIPGVTTTFDVGVINNAVSAPNFYSGANQRLTLYWGRKQAASLSTSDYLSLNDNDFRLCRVKHWLNEQNLTDVSSVLSHEIAPSPDGVQLGQFTWYDYTGKTTGYESEVGTSRVPSIVAQRIPGGETRWVQLQYNSFGLPTTTTSSYTKLDGTVGTRVNTISYANNFYPSLITKTDGSTDWSFSYNSQNQIQTAANALGETTTFTYDSGTHKLVNIAMPNGLNLQLDWAPGMAGTLNHVTAAGYFTNGLTFLNGQIRTLTDPLVLTRTFTFDNLDRLTEVDYPDSTSEKSTYSKLDVVQTVDRLGRTNLFGYNALGQMTSFTNPLQAVTYYNRCVCGLLDSIVTSLGQTYQYTYNNAAQLIKKGIPGSDPVFLAYDYYGRLTNSTDGVSTYSLSYNNQGLATNVSNTLGSVWTGVYDAEDRLVRSTNRNGIGSTNTFDALNRVLTTTWPDGGIENLGYTPGFRSVTAYTNQIGKIQIFGFDGLQRLLTQAVPGVFTNSYAYNGASLITNLLDGNLHQTTWAYDTYGRTIQKNANGGQLVWTNGYNANGWLTAHYTPAKGLATYSYNAVGNLTNMVFPNSTAQSYTYDTMNRLKSMSDAVGTSSFTYTPFGALASENGPWSSDTISYTYTPARLLSGLSLTQPSGTWNQSFQYDAGKRLTGTASPAGSFVYSYLTSSGRVPSLVSQITLPTGASIQNGFDAVGRMQSTALKNPSSIVLDSQSYLFDTAGQRTKTTFATGNYWNYTYDNAGELLMAQGKESGGTSRSQEQLSYGYDAGGNLLNRTNNALIQALSVDGMNQLSSVASSGTLTVAGKVNATPTSVTVNGASATVYGDNTFVKTGQSFTTGVNAFNAVATQSSTTATATSIINIPGSSPFGYDLDGNLVSDGQRQFDYDDQDQLVRITAGITYRSEFTYDALSRRRIEKDYTLGFNSGAALVGVTTLSGTIRNNYSGWVGTQITVGSSPVLVTDLGRWVKSGNTQSHTVKLVAASTGGDIPGASVTINTSGATAGQFAYATLAAPVELQANTTYYLVSQETNGGDNWYEYTSTLSPSFGLTIPGAVYGTGAPYSPVTASNQGYVPVGLKGVVSAQMISASSPSTTVRSNLTGWVGSKITVGTSPIVVTDLGRWVKSGNSQTHTLHMVRASDNVEVAGARVTVNTSGATSGQFLFGTLAAPVTLEANGVYYVLSQETNAGDGWYDTNTPVTPTIGMTLNASVLVDSTGAITLTTGSVSCGPVSFKATPATWTNAKETHYLYDGMLVVQERDASNNPQVSYTRGKDLSGSRRGAGGIGGLLAYTAGGVSQYYHSDGLGNVTALANVNNQLSAAYNYDPYGNLLGSSGPMADLNHYRFSSKEIHPGSGTYTYGYRFYDPSLQRWLNRDPIGEAGGINLYGFVGNEPSAMVDLEGLSGWSIYHDGHYFGPPPSTCQFDPEAATEAAEATAVSMIPGVGEAMDVATIADPDSKWWEKTLSAGSLGINAFGDGALPNVGAYLKGGKYLKEAKRVCKIGAKRGPKTGLKGPHNQKIKEVAENLKKEGNTILNGGKQPSRPEAVIETPGGIKDSRRPDILYKTPNDEVKGVNIGKTKADGSPIKREVEALNDLNEFGELPTDFIPYD